MRHAKKAALAAALLSTAACGGGDVMNVALASVTVTGASPECVRSGMIERATMGGASIRLSTPDMLVVGKPSSNALASALLYTNLTGAPEERVSIVYAQLPGGGGVRVHARGSLVARAGTGLEKSYDVRVSQGELESVLTAVARDCGGRLS